MIGARALGRLAAIALAAWCLPAAAQGEWRPVAATGDALDGTWASRGYGHVVTFSGGQPTLYHVAGPDCYPDPTAIGVAASFALVRRDGPDRVAFATVPDQTHYAFDRIAALPAACTAARTWRPHDIARLIAATFADLYPRGTPRDAARAALIDTLRRTDPAIGAAALHARLVPLLAALNDAHVTLAADIDGAERHFEGGMPPTLAAVRSNAAAGDDPATRERNWSRADRDGVTRLLADGGHIDANRRILWGGIGRVGYIGIATMGAFDSAAEPDDPTALDAVLDTALADFRDLPGVIVDVSNNRGGFDAIGLRIAGRFAAHERTAFTKVAVGTHDAPQRFVVTPSPRPRYTGPVALVTSDITVSAGETFTLAMRALPNVRHVGARTRGSLSDQLDKPLPNGWTLSLSAETYRDAAGTAFEGVGVPPAEAIAPFPGHAAMIAALAARMGR